MGIEQPLLPHWSARSMRWFIRRHDPSGQSGLAAVFGSAVAALLCILSVGLVLVFTTWPEFSYALYAPILIAAGLLLRGRLMAVAMVAASASFLFVAFVLASTGHKRALSSTLALLTIVVLMVLLDRAWERVAGMPQPDASTLLSDLRRRHEMQTHMPDLPVGWSLDSAVLPAGGEALCGDVVVGCAVNGVFNAAVLDVSGKGSTAASRAVLLGGAVSGLLGALEPDRVLPATNDYLVRQGWTDGFATATHVAVELASGNYCLGSAGHPAAVQFHSGSGQWRPVNIEAGLSSGSWRGSAPTTIRVLMVGSSGVTCWCCTATASSSTRTSTSPRASTECSVSPTAS